MDELLNKSISIKDSALETVNSFYNLYEVNTATNAQKEDILRAIVLFSCSAIDAVMKELIYDTLDYVIESDIGANSQFKKQVTKMLSNKDKLDTELLAELFTIDNPRYYLLDRLKKELTYNSLQSSDEIFKIASYFNIPTVDFCREPKILKDIFYIRNQITHELDVDLTSSIFKRRERIYKDIKALSNYIFDMLDKILVEVDKKLKDKMMI